MSDVTTMDLVNYAAENQPDQFRTAFNELIADKIAAAIEARRQEIASNYLSDDEEIDNNEQEIEGQDGQNSEENT
jgi:hypothetical protein